MNATTVTIVWSVPVRLQLPVWYCPGCTTQLATHLFVVTGTDTLLCAFCALRRPAGTVTALSSDAAGFVSGDVPVMDPADAVALLLRLGAEQ